jgi:uncharacterized damage-inducible protein DinB
MAIKDALLAEFDHEVATTRKLLERVPEDRLSWKPHPRSMSLGGLALHVANLPSWGSSILQTEAFDLAEAPPNLSDPGSRVAILELFEKTTVSTRRALDKIDAEFMVPWTLKNGGHQMFTLPRLSAFRSFVMNHLIHHRGQLSVYLRLNDVPLPPIYGPSADER